MDLFTSYYDAGILQDGVGIREGSCMGSWSLGDFATACSAWRGRCSNVAAPGFQFGRVCFSYPGHEGSVCIHG